MKYKVGDRVKIKSLDWYNSTRDSNGWINLNGFKFNPDMKKFCGKTFTIKTAYLDYYRFEKNEYTWTDDMIECLMEDETKFGTVSSPIELKSNAIYLTRERIDETKPEPKFKVVEKTELDSKAFTDGYDQGYDDGQHDMNEWNLPNGFIFKDENGNIINATKIVLEKKKPKYPTTYEECCDILNIRWEKNYTQGYKCGLISRFQELLICRNAYWKIAGDEMELGKSWEPDWKDFSEDTYPTITKCNNRIIKTSIYTHDCFLAFPTAEVRDAFYEHFNDLIESCKELL